MERFLQLKRLGLTVKEALAFGRVSTLASHSTRINRAGGNSNILDREIAELANTNTYKTALNKIHQAQKTEPEEEQ